MPCPPRVNTSPLNSDFGPGSIAYVMDFRKTIRSELEPRKHGRTIRFPSPFPLQALPRLQLCTVNVRLQSPGLPVRLESGNKTEIVSMRDFNIQKYDVLDEYGCDPAPQHHASIRSLPPGCEAPLARHSTLHVPASTNTDTITPFYSPLGLPGITDYSGVC